MSNSSKLIDIFPPEKKKKYVRDNIKRGLIIKGNFPGIASYDKFYVFMGLDSSFQTAYGYFINSEPHPLSSRNLHILRAQVEINPGSYQFLPYPTPSYINCQEPYSKDFFDLVNTLVESPSKICGHLTDGHLEWVIIAIENNPALSPEEKSLLTDPILLPQNFLS